jgi:hypothetical protein
MDATAPAGRVACWGFRDYSCGYGTQARNFLGSARFLAGICQNCQGFLAVAEVAGAGEDHGDAETVGGFDDLEVAD